MAFVFSILMSGFVVYGLYRLTRSPEARRNFFRETVDDPLSSAFVGVWVLCWMMFFWGIFIPPLGELPLFGLKVWQVGGIGSLVGFVLELAVKRLGH